MFGRSKFQPGVLIQPTRDEAYDPRDVTRLAEYRTNIWYSFCAIALSRVINSVWFHRGSIDKANEQAPQHSRIYKEVCYHVCCEYLFIQSSVR